jgi:hypothetical protein
VRIAQTYSRPSVSDMMSTSPERVGIVGAGGSRPSFGCLRILLLVAAASVLAVRAHANPTQDYMLYCMGCHGPRAEGIPGKVPPLAHVVGLYMRTSAGRNYVLRVPGVANSALSDGQLAAVLNWLAQGFDPNGLSKAVPLFSPSEVTVSRHSPLASVLATRREVIRDLAESGPAPSTNY